MLYRFTELRSVLEAAETVITNCISINKGKLQTLTNIQETSFTVSEEFTLPEFCKLILRLDSGYDYNIEYQLLLEIFP